MCVGLVLRLAEYVRVSFAYRGGKYESSVGRWYFLVLSVLFLVFKVNQKQDCHLHQHAEENII